jgi:hypothetical protein
MIDDTSLRDWLSENCCHLWSLLQSRARRQLRHGLLEYLSPPSEAQLDKLVPKNLPPLPPGSFSPAQLREQHTAQKLREGKQRLKEADECVQRLIEICGRKAVEDTYRQDLSNAATEDQLAEVLCEIAFCAGVSALSSTPPRLRPPSSRLGRNTHCDVRFEVGGVAVYGEVKRYPDPWLRGPGGLVGRGRLQPEELQPIELYRKLQNVSEQFPVGTVNLVCVHHASFNHEETLGQALLGWRNDRPPPACPKSGPPKEAGLFAPEDWRDISGCCLSRVTEGKLQALYIWNNPYAHVPLPQPIHGALEARLSPGF